MARDLIQLAIHWTMYIGPFYFQFPLYIVSGPMFPLIEDYVPVFTEVLHAERYRQGNQVYKIENVDDLEYVADHYRDDAVGICFDPVIEGVRSISKRPVSWQIVRLAIELERLEPDAGHIEM